MPLYSSAPEHQPQICLPTVVPTHSAHVAYALHGSDGAASATGGGAGAVGRWNLQFLVLSAHLYMPSSFWPVVVIAGSQSVGGVSMWSVSTAKATYASSGSSCRSP